VEVGREKGRRSVGEGTEKRGWICSKCICMHENVTVKLIILCN
jgi:hypothetical protein